MGKRDIYPPDRNHGVRIHILEKGDMQKQGVTSLRGMVNFYANFLGDPAEITGNYALFRKIKALGVWAAKDLTERDVIGKMKRCFRSRFFQKMANTSIFRERSLVP
jgi:hypothetical protein